MKQSTKLLSLVLALVLAFSCMSVIGNAELVKSEVTWDNIDDAKIRYILMKAYKSLVCFHGNISLIS